MPDCPLQRLFQLPVLPAAMLVPIISHVTSPGCKWSDNLVGENQNLILVFFFLPPPPPFLLLLLLLLPSSSFLSGTRHFKDNEGKFFNCSRKFFWPSSFYSHCPPFPPALQSSSQSVSLSSPSSSSTAGTFYITHTWHTVDSLSFFKNKVTKTLYWVSMIEHTNSWKFTKVSVSLRLRFCRVWAGRWCRVRVCVSQLLRPPRSGVLVIGQPGALLWSSADTWHFSTLGSSLSACDWVNFMDQKHQFCLISYICIYLPLDYLFVEGRAILHAIGL